jgi:hypothetical protein
MRGNQDVFDIFRLRRGELLSEPERQLPSRGTGTSAIIQATWTDLDLGRPFDRLLE